MRDRRARAHSAHERERELGEEADAGEAHDESMLVVRRDADRLVRRVHFPTGACRVPELEVFGAIVGESASEWEVVGRDKVVRELVEGDELGRQWLLRLQVDQLPVGLHTQIEYLRAT